MAASLIAGLMQHKSKSDLADQVTHTSSLMEQMPEADAIVYSGQLFKCPFFSSGATWRKVFVCTTEEQLFMSQFETDPNCIDRIPLHEVTQIDKSELKIRVGKEEFQTFDILTKPDGHNQGRKYQFRVAPEKFSGWVNHLTGQTEEAKRLFIEKNRKTLLQQVKIFAKRVHDSDEFQQFFGVIIMLSFAISLVQSEMVPVEGSREDEIFQYLDYVFTGFFTLELIVTFVGHFGLIFFMDSWRIFDTAIVAISLVAASGLKMPAVKSIRAMRVLRAVRLLKKSKSLRPIVEALFASVLPVMNSMVLLGLVTAIYSSMAVGLFGESHPVMFGKLTRAMFTMFQVPPPPPPLCICALRPPREKLSVLSNVCGWVVMTGQVSLVRAMRCACEMKHAFGAQVCTGDGWATDITRELFDENGMTKPVPVVFFVSYMLVASLVLINIIIAVLLDEFLTTMSRRCVCVCVCVCLRRCVFGVCESWHSLTASLALCAQSHAVQQGRSGGGHGSDGSLPRSPYGRAVKVPGGSGSDRVDPAYIHAAGRGRVGQARHGRGPGRAAQNYPDRTDRGRLVSHHRGCVEAATAEHRRRIVRAAQGY